MVGLSLAFGGQHYGEVLIALGGCVLAGNVEVNFGWGLHEKRAVRGFWVNA